MGPRSVTRGIVVPIENGRAIRRRKTGTEENHLKQETPAVRRLMQCMEMMMELTREVAKTH